MSINAYLVDPEARKFWKDIYYAAIRSGLSNLVAAARADQAVLDFIARAK